MTLIERYNYNEGIPKDCSDVVEEVLVVKTVGCFQDDRRQQVVEEQLRREPGGDQDNDDVGDDHDKQIRQDTWGIPKLLFSRQTNKATYLGESEVLLTKQKNETTYLGKTIFI